MEHLLTHQKAWALHHFGYTCLQPVCLFLPVSYLISANDSLLLFPDIPTASTTPLMMEDTREKERGGIRNEKIEIRLAVIVIAFFYSPIVPGRGGTCTY